MDNIFDILESRGYVYQCTNMQSVKSIMTNTNEKFTFYLGIDPTADSLHIGHFFALMMFRYLQDAGHKGILVIGGATALIGDPSGKSDMRKMLTKDQVNHNVNEVITLAKRFIRTDGDNPALILNNSDWINPYSYIDFMRTIGVHFNIKTMLSAEAYTKRLEQGGLTFLEMGYMLMQAFDFVHLHQTYGCILQIGGSDQWGNIVAGTSLNRKMYGNSQNYEEVFGLTCPLLLTKEGKKMGKTESGTLWVAREKTTPYDFYQYFYNVNDEDVEKLFKLFTRLPLNDIAKEMDGDIRKAKHKMAYEITKLVHGDKEAAAAQKAAHQLFASKNLSEDMPTVTIPLSNENTPISVIDLIQFANVAKSKSEARRLIMQGGISINQKKITDVDYVFDRSSLEDTELLLQKGKKTFVKLSFKK